MDFVSAYQFVFLLQDTSINMISSAIFIIVII